MNDVHTLVGVGGGEWGKEGKGRIEGDRVIQHLKIGEVNNAASWLIN